MAQEVGYFENNVTYTEGPFVLVWAGGWRIEVEQVGHYCPVLPDLSIYEYLDGEGYSHRKSEQKQLIAESVDLLNLAVEAGKIVCENGTWKVVHEVE